MYRTLFTQTLGPTETAIMHQLWQRGPATASELYKALIHARPVTYSTVKTIAHRLCKKGIVVRHTLADRSHDPYCYTPKVTRVELMAAVIEKMCADLAATTADRRAIHSCRVETLAWQSTIESGNRRHARHSRIGALGKS